MDAIETGIVVPTLGTRPEYLEQCLLSIRHAGGAFINIVTPAVDSPCFKVSTAPITKFETSVKTRLETFAAAV